MDDLDQGILLELVQQSMPYGKYQGRILADIREHYLVWVSGQCFPDSKLGRQLALLYQIKLNGLEYLLESLRKSNIH